MAFETLSFEHIQRCTSRSLLLPCAQIWKELPPCFSMSEQMRLLRQDDVRPGCSAPLYFICDKMHVDQSFYHFIEH